MITEGTVDGDTVSFAAPMTEPMKIDISFEGTVDGDEIAGQVTIKGSGSFPFSGTRA